MARLIILRMLFECAHDIRKRLASCRDMYSAHGLDGMRAVVGHWPKGLYQIKFILLVKGNSKLHYTPIDLKVVMEAKIQPFNCIQSSDQGI